MSQDHLTIITLFVTWGKLAETRFPDYVRGLTRLARGFAVRIFPKWECVSRSLLDMAISHSRLVTAAATRIMYEMVHLLSLGCFDASTLKGNVCPEAPCTVCVC